MIKINKIRGDVAAGDPAPLNAFNEIKKNPAVQIAGFFIQRTTGVLSPRAHKGNSSSLATVLLTDVERL